MALNKISYFFLFSLFFKLADNYLPYCNGFCHTSTWIHIRYTCPPPLFWHFFLRWTIDYFFVDRLRTSFIFTAESEKVQEFVVPGITRNSVKSMLQWGFVGSCLRKVRPVGPSRTVTSWWLLLSFPARRLQVCFLKKGKHGVLDVEDPGPGEGGSTFQKWSPRSEVLTQFPEAGLPGLYVYI